MATLTNKRSLAALNKENHEEHPRSNGAQKTMAPGTQEDHITQVSEEIEGKVSEKFSKKFNETQSNILGVFSRLDEFLLSPLIQDHSGSARETSRNAYGINQGSNADDYRSDIHPEARDSQSHNAQRSGPDENYDMLTGVHRKTLPAALERLQENKGRRVPQVSYNSAVRTHLRRFKQTGFVDLSAVGEQRHLRQFQQPHQQGLKTD